MCVCVCVHLSNNQRLGLRYIITVLNYFSKIEQPTAQENPWLCILSIFIILFYFILDSSKLKNYWTLRVSWKNHQWISSFDFMDVFQNLENHGRFCLPGLGELYTKIGVFDFVENLQLLNSKNRLNILLPFGGLFQCWLVLDFKRNLWSRFLTLFVILYGNFGLGLRLNFNEFLKPLVPSFSQRI